LGTFIDSVGQAFGLLLHLDRYTFEIILLSLRVSGTAVVIAVVLGVPPGIMLGLAPFRGRRLTAAVVNTGLSLPPVVVGLFVYMMISQRGPFHELVSLYTVEAMITAQVIIAAPAIMAITMAAVVSVPPDFRLQAMGLGASRRQVVYLVFREARISIIGAVVTGFGAIISEVGAVAMVGGNIVSGGQPVTRVMTTAILLETQQGNFEYAMALGIVLLLIAFSITLALTFLQVQGARRWSRS